MSFNIETKCVQSGYTPKNGEPRVVPIVQSTTYKYESSEQMGRLFDLQESGYFYTRLQNPTNDCVAAKIADLEGGVGAMLTSSGQAASFFSVFNICSAGDHVVAASAIYGGTFNLFNVTMRKLGIDFTFVRPDATEEELNAAFKDNTKAVFAETISNPSLVVLDIEKYARAAHSHGVPLIVDNTFPTPINCRPFEFGADIVTHSTTKYMDGHATSVGGVIVDSGNFDWTQNDKFPGLTIQSPMNAFLLNLGLETLHLRMPRHCSNALAVAKFLKAHPKIESVRYPGLEGDEYYDLAQKYMPNGTCGVISLRIKGGREDAVRFMDSLKLAAIVTHVADSRTCCLHPASTTHRQLTAQELDDCGVYENLVRLSVGTENVDDIIADLDAALANV